MTMGSGVGMGLAGGSIGLVGSTEEGKPEAACDGGLGGGGGVAPARSRVRIRIWWGSTG